MPPRSGHSAVLVGGSQIVVFGGLLGASSQVLLNDVWRITVVVPSKSPLAAMTPIWLLLVALMVALAVVVVASLVRIWRRRAFEVADVVLLSESGGREATEQTPLLESSQRPTSSS